ncbi:MAG: 3-dehydroquinate synthase [Bradymonadales bacterium]|nr:3-dehydroquinate synthase [Bradymonadales bacterium]
MLTTVTIRLPDGQFCPVVVGAQSRTKLAELLPGGCAAVALVSDENVAHLHGEEILSQVEPRFPARLITFPAGEIHKCRATKEQIEDAMLSAGLGRDCAVVALGGGVTCDLAGFVASTYMRGVPWIAIPTSLLAAVDAGIGGKTGVNTPAGKNLVGTFHQPLAVVIDLDLIRTLPADQVENGLAEMVKHGVVADARYLEALLAAADRLYQGRNIPLELVKRSIQIKGEIVADDPREAGRRALLNFGHTIGHAIEQVDGFRISHGRAVAAGMSVEAGIATRLGLLEADQRDHLREILGALALPTAPPSRLPLSDLVEATRLDKKSRQGDVRYVLPCRLGEMARSPDGGFLLAVEGSIVLAELQEVAACCASPAPIEA